MAEIARNHIVRRRFGAFEIDLQSGELRKHGIRLRLSGQPFHVLTILLEQAGEVVTREELHSKLWPAETFVDFDHGLNNAVARIREVLEDSSSKPRFVETIPRRGYRFITPVVPVQLVPVQSSADSPAFEPGPVAATGVADVPMVEPTTRDAPAAKGSVWVRRRMLFGGVAVVVALAAILVYNSFVKTRPQGIHSLVVLPLKNLSGDSRQEYLADGLTEELIGRLAGIRDLRVISRTSSMRFKESSFSAKEIARRLGVDALVEGSVLREGSHIRIHAQLIRGETDAHIWSETYDREISDSLVLESQVAQAIAEKVSATVSGEERARLVTARRVSPEVYESYLKGEFGSRNTRAEIKTSIGYFETAIRDDPTFAPAYLGLARSYDSLSLILIGGAPPSEARAKMISAVKQALSLDPSLAGAHVLLAGVYQKRWQWSEAEAECKRALQLAPNDAQAHMAFALLLMCQGHTEEAISWARRGRELDPMSGNEVSLAFILFLGRQYDQAIRELRNEIAVHPDLGIARFNLCFALIASDQAAAAIPEGEKMLSLMNRGPGALEVLATAYAHEGRRAEALALINELKQRRARGYVPAGAFINPYLALHEYDETFVWFEQAYAEKSNILQFVKVHPFFDPVRGDPRFQDLVRRVGL